MTESTSPSLKLFPQSPVEGVTVADPTKTFMAPPRFEPVILMVSPFVADAGLTVVVTGVFVLE